MSVNGIMFWSKYLTSQSFYGINGIKFLKGTDLKQYIAAIFESSTLSIGIFDFDNMKNSPQIRTSSTLKWYLFRQESIVSKDD